MKRLEITEGPAELGGMRGAVGCEKGIGKFSGGLVRWGDTMSIEKAGDKAQEGFRKRFRKELRWGRVKGSGINRCWVDGDKLLE